MKKLVAGIIAAVLISVMAVSHNQSRIKASDEHIRDRVVTLHSEDGMCTGIKVKAESGASYILTAAHCRGLMKDGYMNIKLEDGSSAFVRFVEEDEASDLMLLESNDSAGIPIAKEVKMHEKVHTLTHGGNRPIYRTDGEILGEEDVAFLNYMIQDDEGFEACSGMAKIRVVSGIFSMACITQTTGTQATAAIIHGSSGGPLLNVAGELVGIASALGNNEDYYFVRLQDINRFMKDR